jgi:hypothetical protein
MLNGEELGIRGDVPVDPLSRFHVYRQLHGWIPPPQVISTDSAH